MHKLAHFPHPSYFFPNFLYSYFAVPFDDMDDKEVDLLKQADQSENVSLDQFGNISTPSLKSTFFSQ